MGKKYRSGRYRLFLFMIGLALVVSGLVFAKYVNVVSITWGDTELFSSVISTLLTVVGGFVVVRSLFRS